MFTVTTLFSILLGILAFEIRQDKKIEDIRIRKEELKLSLLADVTIIYIEKSKESTKQLLEIVSEFKKVV